MDKIKIIVFGDLPISTKVCKFLLDHDRVDLIGVVIGNKNFKNNDPWIDVPSLEVFANQIGLTKYQFDDLPDLFDQESLNLGISCRFSRILKRNHIKLFQNGIINFHGGLLPEFGGLYSACHTILEESSIGGGTIHFINEGIDTGHIIKRCEFNVLANDTAESIFKKTQISLYKGFTEVFNNIIENRIKIFEQEYFTSRGYPKRYYSKDSLKGKKEFDLNDPEKKIDRCVRAFDYPDHQPAFFKIGDEKFFVRKSYK
jgi:methionyl-tRNA formyltransferase